MQEGEVEGLQGVGGAAGGELGVRRGSRGGGGGGRVVGRVGETHRWWFGCLRGWHGTRSGRGLRGLWMWDFLDWYGWGGLVSGVAWSC